MIKVVLYEDNPQLREGLTMLIDGSDGFQVLAAYKNCNNVTDEVEAWKPDVILMDINLPDKSGIDLCKQVKEKYPSIFIIGLSTFNQLSFIQKMMDSGASGYVLKNASQTELMEAIETVAKGKIYFSDEASKTLQKNEATHIILTRREKEVLELIAEGMTNNVIGQKLFISTATVDTHRKNLLAKLNAKNTASLVRMATQLQLI